MINQVLSVTGTKENKTSKRVIQNQFIQNAAEHYMFREGFNEQTAISAGHFHICPHSG